MNRFWKKQLPAFVLTLVMLVSLAPAVFAESACPNSSTGHKLGDWEVSKAATCVGYGTEIQRCTLCGAPVNTRNIEPTGIHDFQDEEALVPATCTTAGKVRVKCTVCGEGGTRDIPALGHAPDANGECTRCHQIVSTPTTTYTVSYRVGSSTYSSEQVRRGSTPSRVPGTPGLTTVAGNHVFVGWTSGSISYPGYRNQSIVTPASIAVSGNTTYTALYRLRATGRNDSISVGNTSGRLVGSEIRNKVAAMFSALTGEGRFSTIYFSSLSGSGKLYNNSRQDSLYNNYTYDQLADYVYFVPSTSGSLGAAYTAEDSYGNRISGTISLSGTSAASSDILLRVAPGGSVDLRDSRFEEAYRKLSGGSGSLRYVEFFPGTDYDSFTGRFYAGSRSFDRDRLNRSAFYVNGASSGDYLLSEMTFEADRNAVEGREISMTFRVHDRSTYYDGTLRIVVDKDSKQDGDVVYYVAPGGSVTFNRSDFNQAYQDLTGTSRTISYVVFDPGDSYTNFPGKISVTGHSDYTKQELGREWFYYTGDRRDSYTIDDLVFRTYSGSRDGDKLEIPFTAYYDRDDRVDGTLRIVVDKNGSQDTISLNVAPGASVRLDRTEFNKVYQALSDTSRTINAVSFYAPDSYRNFGGALYVNRTELYLADLAHDETWFYYSNKSDGDYALEDVTFQADRNARENSSISIPFRAYYGTNGVDYEEGTLRITITSAVNTITYEAAPGGSISFTADDFNRAYQSMSGTSRTIKYITLEAGSDYASFAGGLYAGNVLLTRSDLTHTRTLFYNGTPNYGTYSIGSLYFRPNANAADQSSISIPFRAYYDANTYEQGTVKLVVSTGAGGDIAYTVTPGRTVNFDRVKFEDFLRKSYSNSSLDYVVFDTPSTTDFPDSCGTLYAGYNTSYSTSFSRSNLRDARFYYNSNDARQGDYALNDLTFAAANSFTSGKVTLRFTAYGTNDRSVEGTVVITPTTASVASNVVGSVRYAVTTGTNVQINANDLARFYKKSYPSGTLQYVVLNDVPAAGGLYYNYYSASSYGTSSREQITTSNRSRNFYMSPASTGEYALTELTYVPSGSNYCVTIPFTAYGANGQSVTGGILISVTNKTVSEVYGPTPRNTTVTFPASSIAAAVNAATGTTPSGVQLLSLPAASVGTIYVGTGATPANTTTVYGYNTGAQQLGQLRFVPQTGYTGPVEIPYVALNASNVPIASGVFSMGVLNSNKKFNDITSATWCYKYVTELADASVIDGYADGNFKPDNTITYGAALKLIMLAAGYSEQAPTVAGSTFSGYLAKAQADGLVTRSTVALNGPITRLQVAQLAAGALKLDINNLSSVKPFTDTADVYVQALNAAGIVEGYFNNGTSTFRPSNTLTRGQVSAIVWRMQNYRR